jgi:hypothetical protein
MPPPSPPFHRLGSGEVCYLRDADGIRGNCGRETVEDGFSIPLPSIELARNPCSPPYFPRRFYQSFLRGRRRGYASARHSSNGTPAYEYASASEEAVHRCGVESRAQYSILDNNSRVSDPKSPHAPRLRLHHVDADGYRLPAPAYSLTSALYTDFDLPIALTNCLVISKSFLY